jgi:hypothetical protein
LLLVFLASHQLQGGLSVNCHLYVIRGEILPATIIRVAITIFLAQQSK